MGNHRDIIKNVSDQPLENPLTRASRELFQTCLELGSVTSASLAAHLGIDEESVASRFKRAKNQIQDMYPEAADIHDRTAMLFLSLNAGWVSFVPKPPRLTRGGGMAENRRREK